VTGEGRKRLAQTASGRKKVSLSIHPLEEKKVRPSILCTLKVDLKSGKLAHPPFALMLKVGLKSEKKPT